MGMVFQRPNPFPTMSIFENVIAGYKLNGIRLKKSEKDEIVERSLRDVALWDEVKDTLHKKGTFLSGAENPCYDISGPTSADRKAVYRKP